VAFSIDEPATFSFTGELTHGTVFGGTALFRKNDGGLFLTHSASESPTFADAGVLSPGTYTLVAFASVNISLFPGASLADSCGFDIALALGTVCEADFNLDASVDFFDYDDFVQCFEGGTCPIGRQPDFNADGTVDFFDYDDFAIAFELSC
jgi:hypothetical protein